MRNEFVIKKPHITEKSTELNKVGKYVFIVEPSANKNEIKKTLKKIYGVEVVKVWTVSRPPKRKRFKNVRGVQMGYKKAIVTLKKGQKIDIE